MRDAYMVDFEGKYSLFSNLKTGLSMKWRPARTRETFSNEYLIRLCNKWGSDQFVTVAVAGTV